MIRKIRHFFRSLFRRKENQTLSQKSMEADVIDQDIARFEAELEMGMEMPKRKSSKDVKILKGW